VYQKRIRTIPKYYVIYMEIIKKINKRLMSYADDRKEIARNYLLNIYANPLINKLSY